MANLRNAFLAIARQTEYGTPATTGFIRIPLTGGKMGYSEKSYDEERETFKDGADVSVKEIKHMIDFKCRSYTDLMPLLVYSILGSIVSTGDTEKTHIITPGNTVPRLTIIDAQDNGAGGYDYVQYSDVLISSVKFSSEKQTGAADVEVSGQAEVRTGAVAAPVYTTDLAIDGAGKIIALGALMKYTPNADALSDVTAKLEKWGFELSRDMDESTVYGTGVVLVDAKSLTVKASATLKAEKKDWRAIMTGSDAGTSISSAVIAGALEATMKSTDNAAHTMKSEIKEAVFKPSDLEANPDGGAYQMDIETDTSTAIPTFTIINSITSY